MRILVPSIAALSFVLLAACGGHTIRDACENLCSCGPFGGASGSLCVDACVDDADKQDVSSDCIDCNAEASCKEITDDKCKAVCDR